MCRDSEPLAECKRPLGSSHGLRSVGGTLLWGSSSSILRLLNEVVGVLRKVRGWDNFYCLVYSLTLLLTEDRPPESVLQNSSPNLQPSSRHFPEKHGCMKACVSHGLVDRVLALCICMCVYVYTHACMHTYVHTYECKYIYIYVCAYVWILLYIYVAIYVYICIHKYTYVYTYIHAYKHVVPSPRTYLS